MSETRDPEDAGMSKDVLANLGSNVGFPQGIENVNKNISHFKHLAPGIFEVRKSLAVGPKPLIIVGGIHGDEKAGIVILDDIIKALCETDMVVRRDLLLIYGNLESMKANDFTGVRCVETEFGELSNLNRCFGRGQFKNPRNYAERRANEIMSIVEKFVAEVGVPDVIDIHQSFAVPTLEAVRGNTADRSDYTYAMAYPVTGVDDSLRWFYEDYSDIVAAVVFNDMSNEHHTFAGYMAQKFGSNASTFEQGTIGYTDFETFVPQLTKNLLLKISGRAKIEYPEGFDVWRYVRSITKLSDDFRFVDTVGKRRKAPRDFMPRNEGVIATDGSEIHRLHEGECLLFANDEVPIGDRAAAVVERFPTNVVPNPK